MAKFLFQPTHNMSRTNIYHTWRNMKARCDNPNLKSYQRYGGRGITVCDEWVKSFQAFYEWAITNGYQKGLTLDRIDNDKGYCPENCRWATWEQQSRNKSRNVMLTYNGKTQCMTDWAKERGISFDAIKKRYRTGKPIDVVLYQGKLKKNEWRDLSERKVNRETDERI